LAVNGRYLITTADERTWKFDRPVLFLGEWCRLYDRRHIWQDMDAIVAEPYGLGQEKKDADYTEARALEESLYPILQSVLNQHHGMENSERFWQIVLGHWLRRYVDVLFNRSKTLEACLNSNKIVGTMLFNNVQPILATQNSYSSILDFNSDIWNNALYGKLLHLLKKSDCTSDFIALSEMELSPQNASIPGPVSIKTFFKWAYQKLWILTRYLVRNTDGFIINSYLPKLEEIKLQLALGQCPQFWISPKPETTEKPDWNLRRALTSQINKNSKNHLEKIVKTLLFELLPVSYLEGFADLGKQVRQQPWPSSPKFIFTSNNFDKDDVFKLWAATKIESGAKYFIGQHGNNYGTHRYFTAPIEEVTPNKFISWGWTDGLPQHTAAFNLKLAGQKTSAYNPLGGLLLIELHIDQRLKLWDSTFEFTKYFIEQLAFVADLTPEIKRHLTVRLHKASRSLSWNEDSRWRKYDPTIRIDIGDTSLIDHIAQSRLIVHSYDSTGILETLSQNIPTLAFWQNGFEHLRESARPYYQNLVDAGIVHLTPESVARKVSVVWSDIDAWWSQDVVQDARKIFCDRYAKVSQKPIHELKHLFTNQI
jgi:putative transferase (TIGR04331 family)